ncbi:MAG: DUF72 domain-containing protein [Geminicoccaceae bacterium]|nr:DUF72 domain-containing protein [Geminicoccaceae bacterium]
MARLFVGTSGWSYKEWRSGFYAGVPQARWLAHYASVFPAVELNGTFYRAARPGMLERWCEITPPSFVFTAKGHRVTTHYRQLKDAAGDVVRQRDLLAPLGERLAVVVWQLPARLKIELGRLEAFGDALGAWPGTRHAIEFRHASWFTPEVERLLHDRAISNVISDAPTFPRWDAVTSDLAYVRLHGDEELYRSSYDERALGAWAGRCRAWLEQGSDVHVYFDNTDRGAAPVNACHLLSLVTA